MLIENPIYLWADRAVPNFLSVVVLFRISKHAVRVFEILVLREDPGSRILSGNF